MSDVIKTIIETTGDRTQVFKLIVESGDPIAVLHVWTPALTGELWIEKSKRIFFAKTTPSVSSGMMALLQLLAVKGSKFTLKLSDKDRPTENVDISLKDLIADEQAVIQEIKNVLWPVIERESDILTEAVPALSMDMLNDVYSQAQERERKEWEALRAAEQQAPDDIQDFTPPTETAPERKKIEPVEEDEQARTVPPSPKVSTADSAPVQLTESPAEATASGKAPEEDEQARTVPPSGKLSTADSHPVQSTESPVEAAASGKASEEDEPAPAVPPSNQASLLESSPVQSLESPVKADQFDKPVTEFDARPSLETSINTAETEIAESLSEDQAYALLQEMIEKAPSSQSDDEGTEFAIQATAALTAEGGVLGELNDNDPVTQKRRVEMVELQTYYGEEPEKFFVPAESPVMEDDIVDHRKAEMEALSSMLAVHADLQKVAFEDTEPLTPDEQGNQRKQQFDVLREFFGEKPENFYDEGAIADVDTLGQEELRSKVLKVMEEESDPETFAEIDPVLSNTETLLPDFVQPEPEPVAEEPVKVIDPLDDYTPPDLEPSPYGKDGSELNFGEKLKGKLLLEGNEDNKSLLDRAPNAQNKFGKIDRDTLRNLERLPRHMLVSVCLIAALLPLIVLFINNHFNGLKSADKEDELAVAQLANMASQDASNANKSQQAFRMPGGGLSPTGAGGGGNTPEQTPGGSDGGAVTNDELSHYKYHEPATTVARPTVAQQTEAARDLALGDQMMSQGQSEDATRVLANGLLKCPNHPQLRIRTARAYMSLGQYQSAKSILLAGMSDASSEGEYNMYLAVLKELPRQ